MKKQTVCQFLACVAMLAWMVVGLSGCAPTIAGHIPTRQAIVGSGQFEAGASKVDLTPIPGIPMGGYSIAGKVSRGFWTRLYARAIYLQDPNGLALVLVSCDLVMIPNGLADRVAELLGQHASLSHIGRENLILAATHTHQSPGNYFSSKMYNGLSTPRPGFDRHLFEFLAARIVQAIQHAEQHKEAAILRANQANDDSTQTNWLPGFFRNRSFGAFRLNREAQDYLGQHASLPVCAEPTPDYPQLACRAVDPRIEFLAIVKAAAPDEVIALAVFLAAHPTVMTPDTEVYSGDLFGTSALLLERSLMDAHPACQTAGPLPIVALFNGAEGDVSAMWKDRDRAELIDLGEKLAKKVCDLLPGHSQAATQIAFQYHRIDPIVGHHFPDQSAAAQGYDRGIPYEPEPGAPTLGGAPDGRTIFYELGLQQGLKSPHRDEQGAKIAPGEFELGTQRINIARFVFKHDPPPSRSSIGVYRIGNIALVSLPGEFTTIMGERIRTQIRAELADPSLERVVLVGLANGHVSYFTTPEEYDAQFYEGASNFYGAATGPFFAYQLKQLASDLATGSTPPHPTDFCYEPGKERSFQPRDAWGPPYWVDDGLSAIVQDLSSQFPKRDFPTFCWLDAVPQLAASNPPLVRVVPDVAIERVSPLSVVDDNTGLNVVTLSTGVAQTQMEWCAIWMVPSGIDQTQSYRFRVDGIDGSQKTSLAFQPQNGAFLERPSASPLLPDCLSGFWCHPLVTWLGRCNKVCQGLPPPPSPKLCVGCL